MHLILQNPKLCQYKYGVPASIPLKYTILWVLVTVLKIALSLHHVMRRQKIMHKVYTNIWHISEQTFATGLNRYKESWKHVCQNLQNYIFIAAADIAVSSFLSTRITIFSECPPAKYIYIYLFYIYIFYVYDISIFLCN